jgi:hypothetical protein
MDNIIVPPIYFFELYSINSKLPLLVFSAASPTTHSVVSLLLVKKLKAESFPIANTNNGVTYVPSYVPMILCGSTTPPA